MCQGLKELLKESEGEREEEGGRRALPGGEGSEAGASDRPLRLETILQYFAIIRSNIPVQIGDEALHTLILQCEKFGLTLLSFDGNHESAIAKGLSSISASMQGKS